MNDKKILAFGRDITGARVTVEGGPSVGRVAVVAVEVDAEWVADFAPPSSDAFRPDHCGYWLHGRDFDEARPELGWLCWEIDDEHDPYLYDVEPLPGEAEARAAWKSGGPMPADSRWFRLDAAALARAFAYGVAIYGADWNTREGDANVYDALIQLALLGEIRYS